MNNKIGFRNIFWSCDFIIAAVITAVLIMCLPKTLPAAFAREIYGVAIFVLSVLFSVFFALLAIAVTSIEDEFAQFLDEEGHYKAILSTFKFTVLLLFCALALAVLLFASASYWLSLDGNALAYKWHMVVFSFTGLYALLASVMAVNDLAKYVECRSEYIHLKGEWLLAKIRAIGQTIRKEKETKTMREIKFRGKRLDNGEWVCGSAIADHRQYGWVQVQDEDAYWHDVDPETVGQYTGLKDKNGVEIYEGDVLGGFLGGVVVWVPDEVRFGISFGGEVREVFFSELAQSELEVIGNIHDNPELLEEAGEHD